jgi:Tol biopolymer transport system component
MKKIKNISSLLFLAILVLSLFNTPNVKAADFEISSKTIFTFPTKTVSGYSLFPITPSFSLTGEQFAFNRLSPTWASSVIYNGKELSDNFLTTYANPIFSPDGKNFVYFVSYKDNRANAGNYHIIFNGQEYKNYQNVSAANFVFSGNSQYNAFPATSNGKMFIVYDKKEKTKYDYVSAPSLSPDGKTLAYSAKNKKDKKTSLIINDKVVSTYQDIKYPIVFSTNSSHIAYAVKDTKWSLYVDNKKVSANYDDIINISVTNSGKYAFIGKKSNSYVANINGKESKSYISMAGLVISPDEKQSIFIARKGSNEVAVINGKEGAEYPMFAGGSTPAFSPDSKHLVYKTSRFSADGKSRIFLLVIDGQEIVANGWYYSGGFHQGNGINSEFSFSPDGSSLIYYSLKDNNKIVRNELKF